MDLFSCPIYFDLYSCPDSEKAIDGDKIKTIKNNNMDIRISLTSRYFRIIDSNFEVSMNANEEMATPIWPHEHFLSKNRLIIHKRLA
jgi:hypothetical protein